MYIVYHHRLSVVIPIMVRGTRYNLLVTRGKSVVFSEYSVSFGHKTDYHDINEILLKVALNTIYPTSPIPNNLSLFIIFYFCLKSVEVQRIFWYISDLILILYVVFI